MMRDEATAVTEIRRNDYDVERVRADFPILNVRAHGKPLVYLDSAASAQKPRAVIDAERRCYEEEYANVHRGLHYLSEKATDAFERARERVRAFLNVADSREIVFTRGATEAINLVAATYGRRFLKEGDEIVISAMEHHSNIVPWQLLRMEKGITIRVIPIDDTGALRMDEFEKLLSPRTKLVAVTQMSNALGTINPIKEIVAKAHAVGAKVLVDGCQAVPHLPVDVPALGCDFYVFSGHKVYGPSGVGVLWGRYEILDSMPPYQGGGEMIRSVSFEETTFAPPPARFEAGTPAIAQVIALPAALDYLQALGRDAIEAHENDLLAYGTELLSDIPGVRLVGTAPVKAGILSFTMDGAHPHDIGTIVDRFGVAVRAGHHCAQPVMERFGLPATVRASFGLYNTRAEVDALAAALLKVKEIFG